MIRKTVIAALGAAIVLGLRTYSAYAQPLAQAVNDITNFQILGTTPSFISGSSITLAVVPSNTAMSTFSYAAGFPANLSYVAIGSLFPTGPGSAAFASTPAGDPFTSPGVEMDSNAEIVGSPPTAGTGGALGTAMGTNTIALDVSFSGAGATLGFSFTDSVVLQTVGPAATASVVNIFKISGPFPGINTVFNYVPADINTSCSSPLLDQECTTVFTEAFVSPTVTLDPGKYAIDIDPSAQAELVFEPSSMLLLGSGLAAMGLIARRR
jgi:hypothetical protein